MPSDNDDDRVEHFLVDGVAPAVIGGGPPESPYDVAPEPEPEPGPRHRGQHQVRSGPPYGRPPARADHRSDPPTSPIPVIRELPRELVPQKRKSWMARMFRSPGS